MGFKLKDRDVSIAFVGDISLGDFPFCQGYGVDSRLRHEKDTFLFKHVKHIFNESDIVSGNLETVLSHIGRKKNKLSSIEMRGDPLNVSALSSAGFSVLNFANNHSLQHGYDAFWDTVKKLREKDISVIGLKSEDEKWYSKPVVVKKKGITIGFFGYAFTDEIYYKRNIPYAQRNESLIKKDIEKLKSQVDTVIISVHWGLEFIEEPSIETVNIARKMVEWGADVIVGHHPHVLQGIERYKEGIIAYSLGNFVFDMMWDQKYRRSTIMKIVINKEKKIIYEFVPVEINISYQPCILEQNYKFKLSMYSNKKYKNSNSNKEYLKKYKKLRLKNRIYAYAYFFKNFFSYDSIFLIPQLKKTFLSRLEDVGVDIKD